MSCSRTHTKPTPEPSAVAAVYVAVYDSLWKRPGVYVRLIDSTIAMRNASADSTAYGVDARNAVLRTDLAAAMSRRTDLRALLKGRGITLVSRATVDSVFRGEGPTAWSDYDAKYGRGGFAEVSGIGFTPDSLKAAVYVNYHCGAVCGYGSTVTLARDKMGQWRIQRIHQHWVS